MTKFSVIALAGILLQMSTAQAANKSGVCRSLKRLSTLAEQTIQKAMDNDQDESVSDYLVINGKLSC